MFDRLKSLLVSERCQICGRTEDVTHFLCFGCEYTLLLSDELREEWRIASFEFSCRTGLDPYTHRPAFWKGAEAQTVKAKVLTQSGRMT